MRHLGRPLDHSLLTVMNNLSHGLYMSCLAALESLSIANLEFPRIKLELSHPSHLRFFQLLDTSCITVKTC